MVLAGTVRSKAKSCYQLNRQAGTHCMAIECFFRNVAFDPIREKMPTTTRLLKSSGFSNQILPTGAIFEPSLSRTRA